MVGEGPRQQGNRLRALIAEGTVKIHLHNIYEKLKVHRRADLIPFADEYGLK